MHGEEREEQLLLHHVRDALVEVLGPGLSIHRDLSAEDPTGGDAAGENVQQAGLAAAGGAHERHDVVRQGGAAEALEDIARGLVPARRVHGVPEGLATRG